MNTQKFGRFGQALGSAAAFLLTALIGADALAGGSVLIAFSSDRCGHCQAMQPTLDALESAGTPVRHVNVDREPALATRHGVRQVPTYVVLSGGRELTRLVGAQPKEQLLQALAIDPSGSFFHTNANVSQESNLNPPQPPATAATLTSAPAPGAIQALPPAQGEPMPSLSVADAIERAQAATVRLRVHEGRGFGVGTGTVIDRHGEEALVLTCGHLFRETKLDARIEVDLFVGGQIKTVPGQVIDYDADDRDIALVVIRPGFAIPPVQIANPTTPPQNGQSVFSFGCDHGADPSRRDTRITGVNKYNQHLGASNIEIGGAPVDGRSGGGLFDQAGRLVGVCNAADYKGDVGIYTGPGSIQWQLDRVQLSRLYQTPPSAMPAVPAANPPLPSVPSGPATSPNAPDSQTRLASLEAPANSPTGVTPAGATPMTVILMDPNSPNGQRVLTVPQPTPELMEMISRHAR